MYQHHTQTGKPQVSGLLPQTIFIQSDALATTHSYNSYKATGSYQMTQQKQETVNLRFGNDTSHPTCSGLYGAIEHSVGRGCAAPKEPGKGKGVCETEAARSTKQASASGTKKRGRPAIFPPRSKLKELMKAIKAEKRTRKPGPRAVFQPRSELRKNKAAGNTKVPQVLYRAYPSVDPFGIWERYSNEIKVDERPPLLEIGHMPTPVVQHFSLPRRPTQDGTGLIFYEVPTTSQKLSQADIHTNSFMEDSPNQHRFPPTEAMAPYEVVGNEAACNSTAMDGSWDGSTRPFSPAPSSGTAATGTSAQQPQRLQTKVTPQGIKDRFVFLTKRGLEEALISLTD